MGRHAHVQDGHCQLVGPGRGDARDRRIAVSDRRDLEAATAKDAIDQPAQKGLVVGDENPPSA